MNQSLLKMLFDEVKHCTVLNVMKLDNWLFVLEISIDFQDNLFSSLSIPAFKFEELWKGVYQQVKGQI